MATRSDRLGNYLFRDVPVLSEGQWLHIRAEFHQGSYPEDRFFRLAAFRRVRLDLRTPGCFPVWVIGNPPFIDFSSCGSGVIVSADPRTGEPVPSPY